MVIVIRLSCLNICQTIFPRLDWIYLQSCPHVILKLTHLKLFQSKRFLSSFITTASQRSPSSSLLNKVCVSTKVHFAGRKKTLLEKSFWLSIYFYHLQLLFFLHSNKILTLVPIFLHPMLSYYFWNILEWILRVCIYYISTIYFFE